MKVKIQSKDGNETVNLNRRKAIHERCLNCSGWIPKDVARCNLEDCSLYKFRSGKGKQDSDERSKAIRTFCILCMNGQVGEVAKCTSPTCPLYIFRMGSLVKALEHHPELRQEKKSRNGKHEERIYKRLNKRTALRKNQKYLDSGRWC